MLPITKSYLDSRMHNLRPLHRLRHRLQSEIKPSSVKADILICVTVHSLHWRHMSVTSSRINRQDWTRPVDTIFHLIFHSMRNIQEFHAKYLFYHLWWPYLTSTSVKIASTQDRKFPMDIGGKHHICSISLEHGPIARYVKLQVVHPPGMPGMCSSPPLVSEPDMHHGTCMTRVSWCIPGSLTSGFLWSRWRWKRSRHSRCMRNPQFYVSGN